MTTETNIIVQSDSPANTSAIEIAPPKRGIEPPPIELTAEQALAVESITRGGSFTRAAKVAGVDRSTIYRWRTVDPNFIAALNRWREDVHAQICNNLTALTNEAAKSLKKVVRRHEGRLEFRLLEKMGFIEPGAIDPIDPHRVFGNGIHEQTGRWGTRRAMRRVGLSMTEDQRRRVPQLLALGTAFENAKAGRISTRDLLELAGPLANDLPQASTTEQSVQTATVVVLHEGPAPSDPQTTTTVKTSVVRHSSSKTVTQSVSLLRRK